MNELTPELQEKIHAVWDKKVLTPVEASRRVNAGCEPFVKVG
jgi:hypothetical protein